MDFRDGWGYQKSKGVVGSFSVQKIIFQILDLKAGLFEHENWRKKCIMIFWKWRVGWLKAIRSISENSSVLVPSPLPHASKFLLGCAKPSQPHQYQHHLEVVVEGALARTTTPNSTFDETCYKLNLSQNTNVTFSLDESLLRRRAVGPRSWRRGAPADQDQDLSDGPFVWSCFSKRWDAMVNSATLREAIPQEKCSFF